MAGFEQHMLHLAQMKRLHEARGLVEVESDAESSSSSDESYDDDDAGSNDCNKNALPTHFLGVNIDRQSNPIPIPSELPVEEDNVPPQLALPNEDEDNNRPPTPWARSKSKQNIIDNLKDKNSDIHLLIGDYDDNDFNHVNFVKILQTYAGNKYKRSLFRENMKRILRHFRHETGPFKAEEITVEPWYTSVNNVSKGYSLLFMLYMNPKTSLTINEMTEKEIWESHPEFQVYELEKFKTYNQNMKKLTDKRRMQVQGRRRCISQRYAHTPT